LRAVVDAVLVGANTVVRDDPLLTVRYVTGRNPTRVVVDGRLRIPTNSRVVTDKSAKTIVFTSSNAPKDKVIKLLSMGVDVVVLNCRSYELPMGEVLHELLLRGVKLLLVEGGGDTIWGLVKYDLFDEFRITLSPYIVGGRDATPVVGGEGFSTYLDFRRLVLKDVKVCECGNEVHIVYHRKLPTFRMLR
jgi:2,5-diamino-6-(ribosylamino)-4(3H)-pyrimidinone 5'-phosphate reductase